MTQKKKDYPFESFDDMKRWAFQIILDGIMVGNLSSAIHTILGTLVQYDKDHKLFQRE